MPGQDQTPQEAQANPPEVPVTAGAGDNKTQIYQMRQKLAGDIQALKKQALLHQLQAMKVLQQTLSFAYNTQTYKINEQIARQSTDVQQQLEKETEALQSATATDTKNTDDETSSGEAQIQAFNDIVLNAMQAAQQSVDGAMQAAQKIMIDAENMIKGS